MRKAKIVVILLLTSFWNLMSQNGILAKDCKIGAMNDVNSYFHFENEKAPKIDGKEELVIHIDSLNKTKEFIAFEVSFDRMFQKVIDTTNIPQRSDWNKLSNNQKLLEVEKRKNYLKKMTDSLYNSNNESKYYIWIINNSKKKIYFPTQDGSPLIIIEALNENNKWYPIQYWTLSGCGNSYSFSSLKPKMGLRLISKIPEGNFKTKLRYKVLGKESFYYSNEFYGKIDYCSFFEKCQNCDNSLHYKLDYLPEHWE